ncbi:MAG TPA: hypothetical protein VF591_17855 [Pyrinomonadaceae bacterium]
MTHELFKRYAFVFLAVRVLADLTLAGVIYYQEGTPVVSFGFLLLCGVFYYFLYSGLRGGEFRGRYGNRVTLWREPVGYWFVVAFLALFHLFVTVSFGRLVRW